MEIESTNNNPPKKAAKNHLLPLAIFICSIFIGQDKDWGNRRWFTVLFFGLLYMLAEYLTFSLANMFSFGHFNLPAFGMIFVGAAVSAAGIGFGILMNRLPQSGFIGHQPALYRLSSFYKSFRKRFGIPPKDAGKLL